MTGGIHKGINKPVDSKSSGLVSSYPKTDYSIEFQLSFNDVNDFVSFIDQATLFLSGNTIDFQKNWMPHVHNFYGGAKNA